MKVLIIDDEFRTRRVLRKFISETFPSFTFLNDASNVQEAIEIISNDKPELLLVDIHLNDHLSFEIFEDIEFNEYSIIFITAHDEYALKAFEFGAENYILKPIDKEKLISAVQSIQSKNLESPVKNTFQNSGSIERIIIPGNGNSRIVKVSDLIYIKADSVYSTLFLKQESIVASKPLNYFEKKMINHPHFFRIHKSFVINLNYVESIRSDGRMIKLSGNVNLPISRAKKVALKLILNNRYY